MTLDVKFLYCPRCKSLRVKAWYAIRDRCEMCFSDAVVIKIPFTWYLGMLYVLYIASPGCVLVYVYTDEILYLYSGIVLLAAMIFVSLYAISKGEEYAKGRIKMTIGDTAEFRKRGWS